MIQKNILLVKVVVALCLTLGVGQKGFSEESCTKEQFDKGWGEIKLENGVNIENPALYEDLVTGQKPDSDRLEKMNKALESLIENKLRYERSEFFQGLTETHLKGKIYSGAQCLDFDLKFKINGKLKASAQELFPEKKYLFPPPGFYEFSAVGLGSVYSTLDLAIMNLRQRFPDVLHRVSAENLGFEINPGKLFEWLKVPALDSCQAQEIPSQTLDFEMGKIVVVSKNMATSSGEAPNWKPIRIQKNTFTLPLEISGTIQCCCEEKKEEPKAEDKREDPSKKTEPPPQTQDQTTVVIEPKKAKKFTMKWKCAVEECDGFVSVAGFAKFHVIRLKNPGDHKEIVVIRDEDGNEIWRGDPEKGRPESSSYDPSLPEEVKEYLKRYWRDVELWEFLRKMRQGLIKIPSGNNQTRVIKSSALPLGETIVVSSAPQQGGEAWNSPFKEWIQLDTPGLLMTKVNDKRLPESFLFLPSVLSVAVKTLTMKIFNPSSQSLTFDISTPKGTTVTAEESPFVSSLEELVVGKPFKVCKNDSQNVRMEKWRNYSQALEDYFHKLRGEEFKDIILGPRNEVNDLYRLTLLQEIQGPVSGNKVNFTAYDSQMEPVLEECEEEDKTGDDSSSSSVIPPTASVCFNEYLTCAPSNKGLRIWLSFDPEWLKVKLGSAYYIEIPWVPGLPYGVDIRALGTAKAEVKFPSKNFIITGEDSLLYYPTYPPTIVDGGAYKTRASIFFKKPEGLETPYRGKEKINVVIKVNDQDVGSFETEVNFDDPKDCDRVSFKQSPPWVHIGFGNETSN